MKNLFKLSLILAFCLFCLALISYAEQASVWAPEGEISDFEGDISPYVSTTGTIEPETADNVFENSGKALKIQHQSGGYTAKYEKPLASSMTFDENKDYIFSFDIKTSTTDAYRWLDYTSGDTTVHFIRISVINKVLYLCDDWGEADSAIAAISLNEPHSVKLVIDGDSRTMYEIWVDGIKREFNINHFKVLPENIDKIGISQKMWSDTGVSFYDNLCLTASDKLQSSVFYKTENQPEAADFADNSEIEVCAAIDSETDQNGYMYLAVYEEDILSDIKVYEVSLEKGMNYKKGSISIDSNKKVLKVFVWSEGLSPVIVPDVLKGNLSFLEYKARVKSGIYKKETMPSESEIQKILSNINADGSFKNITYSEKTTDYCYEHCSNIYKLALVLSYDAYDFGSINPFDVKVALINGINYWIDTDTTSFTFENWYYENITVPEYIGKLMLITEDKNLIDASTKARLEDYMAQKVKEIGVVSKKDSGSNILQEQRNKSYYAMYIDDTHMLLDCFFRIAKELRLADEMTELGDLWRKHSWQSSVTITGLPTTIDGIQSDYSALFHGPQLYSGTYGLTFLKGVSEFLVDTKGLELFPEDKTQNIIDHLLEHYAYIGRGDVLDYSTVGRMIATKGTNSVSGRFNEVYLAAENLLSLGLNYRRNELTAFVSSKDTTPAITGHKYFYKADYTAHTKKDYLFTLKASSNRTIASEALSYTNLKGRSLGDGATFIYKDGNEYNDIFAAWDWNKIPGTTAENKSFAEINSGTYSYESTLSGRVGGVSDGKNGATAMELIRDGLSAKKGWFMFDDAIVALGTDISNDLENSVFTTVNQCISAGDVKYKLSDGTMGNVIFDSAATKLQNPSWILHNGVGYVFGDNSEVYIENSVKTGDRYDISWNGATSKPKSEFVTRDVFSLWFDHRIDRSKSYEYIIVPFATETELDFIASQYEIKYNTPAVQAVRYGDEIQIAFWQGGMADFDDIKIISDKSCIIMINESGAYVARLDDTVDSVRITISGVAYNVSLPKDGSTIKIK